MGGRFRAGLLAVGAWFGATVAAQAQETTREGGKSRSDGGPFFQMELEASFRIDGPVATDFTPTRAAQMYLDDFHAHFAGFANDWLSLQGLIKGEPVRSLEPRRSEAFRGFGLFIEQLYVNADFNVVDLFVGKIKPTFAYLHDHHRVPGLFAVDFTEDYETVDFVGAGFSLRGNFQEDGWGRHELTAQTFFADRTFLHRSIITAPRAGGSTVERQSRLRKSDGGLGNTERFNNFSVTLDSAEFAFLPGLGIHLGYRFLHRGKAGVAAGTETRNEHGFAIAVDYTAEVKDFILPGKTTIRPAIEWVRLRDASGNRGVATYWGGNLIVNHREWTWHLTGTLRHVDVPGSIAVRDRLFATSLFYQLDNRWRVGGGYTYQRVRDADTGKNTNDHVIGVKIAWSYDFSIGVKEAPGRPRGAPHRH